MPNDLAVRPIAPVPPEPAAAPAVRRGAPAAEMAASGDALPNPTLRLDAALGLVVIEFHNQTGSVTTSIPGARQLDAYRTAREMNTGAKIGGPGPAADAPPGVHSPATRTV